MLKALRYFSGLQLKTDRRKVWGRLITTIIISFLTKVALDFLDYREKSFWEYTGTTLNGFHFSLPKIDGNMHASTTYTKGFFSYK